MRLSTRNLFDRSLSNDVNLIRWTSGHLYKTISDLFLYLFLRMNILQRNNEGYRFVITDKIGNDNFNTVEPRLSEPHGRHTIRPDNRGVRIDEGNRNSRSMGYRVGDN